MPRCSAPNLAEALTSKEREAIEKRIKDAETEIRGLNESIASSEEWLKKHTWMVAGCPFVKAGTTFVVPKTGKQWTIAAYYAALDKSGKPAAEIASLKAKAMKYSNEEARLCQDTYYTSYVAAKAKVATLTTGNRDTSGSSLSAPAPTPTATWSGKYVTPIINTFNFRIEGSKFFNKATVLSGDNIYITDECDWDGKQPLNCTYAEHEGDKYTTDNGGYRWAAEGTSKFVWQDGTIVRTSKANARITVIFGNMFGGGILMKGGKAADVAREKKRIEDEINQKHGAEEFRLRRIGEW